MTNDSPPTISGSATWGSTLTSTTGSWSPLIPGSPVDYQRQWFRCPDATTPLTCSEIPGATGVQYTLVKADVGERIRVEVVASAGALDSASEFSDPTAPVTENPPNNSVAPSFSGEAEQGKTLTRTSYGSWGNPAPTGYSRQWLRCNAAGGACAAIAGATGDGYALVATDVGKTIRLLVRATGPYGSAQAASAPSALVVKPSAPTPSTPKRRRARRLKPFPRILVQGSLSPRGALFRQVVVKGPRNVTVRVRCRGRGCPYRSRSYRMRHRKLRLRSLERNFSSGAVIEVRVVRRGRVGKYTRIRIRRGRVPARLDRCLNPGSSRPRRCAK